MLYRTILLSWMVSSTSWAKGPPEIWSDCARGQPEAVLSASDRKVKHKFKARARAPQESLSTSTGERWTVSHGGCGYYVVKLDVSWRRDTLPDETAAGALRMLAERVPDVWAPGTIVSGTELADGLASLAEAATQGLLTAPLSFGRPEGYGQTLRVVQGLIVAKRTASLKLQIEVGPL